MTADYGGETTRALACPRAGVARHLVQSGIRASGVGPKPREAGTTLSGLAAGRLIALGPPPPATPPGRCGKPCTAGRCRPMPTQQRHTTRENDADEHDRPL